MVFEFPQAQDGHQAVVIKEMRIRSGLSHYWVLLQAPKPLSQIQRRTFLPFQEGSHTPREPPASTLVQSWT